MANDSCYAVYNKLNDQVAPQSPEARKNLSPEEHSVAQKLAADVRKGMQPSGSDIMGWLKDRDTAFADANKLVDGVKDKSRLDGILADASKLLSADDEKLLQTDKGVVIGQHNTVGAEWDTIPLKNLDCESGNNFQVIDRYNAERALQKLGN